MMNIQLRQSTAAETPLQASKWLDIPALLDGDEMTALFHSLPPFSLHLCGSITLRNQPALSKEEFLKRYHAYISCLKEGHLPNPADYQRWFSPAMTATSDALYAIPVADDKQLIRLATPVVQMQAHNINYSPVDKKFRSMVFGSDNIPWGVQFSYPQQYLDNATKQVIQLKSSASDPNTKLFHALQKWIRQHTIPTPFHVENTTQNVPMRLGKHCLNWINRHPQLINKNITVKTHAHD